VTKTLHRDTSAFTGRETELQGVLDAVAQASRVAQVISIHAIDGMPGVGKTAFAIHVGHELATQFPDGQLFIDLHAHTAGRAPVESVDALASLLIANSLDPELMPSGLDDRAALWRGRLAEKRVLLILDNAASTGQVKPLLPNSMGCLVLVTSRRRLTALDAVPVQLDVLPPDQAAEMFIRLTHRPVNQSDELMRLVDLCGYLPLAIALLAGVFDNRPMTTVTHLAAGLETASSRLPLLKAEDNTVAAAFDLSYQQLCPPLQYFFRCLGLHPGSDVDVYAAAALVDVSIKQADEHLRDLYDNHLIDEPVYGRYRMHDLIRDYAHALANKDTAAERETAIGRLFDYYQFTASIAGRRLARYVRPTTQAGIPTTPAAEVPRLDTRGQALSWMKAERANLQACLDQATGSHQQGRIVLLTAAMAADLRLVGPWDEAVILHASAATAARELGDHLSEANALFDLGIAQRLTGDYPGAMQTFQQALNLYRDIPEPLGEANALHYLGIVKRSTADYPGAVQVLQEALTLYRQLGQRLGEGNALNNLGAVWRLTGEFAQATQVHENALRLYRDLADRRGEANALNHLGAVRRGTGDYAAAARLLEQALDLYRDLGDRLGEANALNNLGILHQLTRSYSRATQTHMEALEVSRALGSKLGEANALQGLGVVRQLDGDNLGAAKALQEALALYRGLGDRLGEAEVFNQTGTLHRRSGDLEQALGCHQRALELSRAVHNQLEEAHALEGIGRCTLLIGGTLAAEAALLQALSIYGRIGAAEANLLAADLKTLD
jgi:tetratricopeptide (TPR) repeat protein